MRSRTRTHGCTWGRIGVLFERKKGFWSFFFNSEYFVHIRGFNPLPAWRTCAVIFFLPRPEQDGIQPRCDVFFSHRATS